MEFTTIYRNGKPQYFFIKIDRPEEFNFLQPYFILTCMDHTRFDRILEMECLFSGSVWQGRQRHGYGYSCSADVYGSLLTAIRKLHKGNLSPETIKELDAINTHDSDLHLSDAVLAELSKLNQAALESKYC